ncbi:hypothetical protein B0H11DRAFT_1908128 [Mycena galericulata]|nr:hypothetical protein B0H11DRAFT_1908128 [Mycena galericulata]
MNHGPQEKKASKVTVPNIKSVLLNPSYGFTTNKPRVTSPHPPKSGSRSSVTPQTVATAPLDDPVQKRGQEPFVRVHHGQPFDEMTFVPEAFEIPEDGRIKLFVNNLGPISGLEIEPGSSTIPQDGPSASTHTVSGAGTIQREEMQTPAVKCLREKLATRDGYETFTAHRGHVLSNPDIVKDWQFAVNFTRDYNKAKTPVKINKEAISAALGIRSTWLANAHTAIGTYGQVPEVAEVSTRIDPLPGATALFAFLTGWKKNHPIMGWSSKG